MSFSKMLSAGMPLNLPADALKSATEAAQTIRLKEEAQRTLLDQQKKKKARNRVAALALVVGGVFCWQAPVVRYQIASLQDTPEAYAKVLKEFPTASQFAAANRRYRQLTDDSASSSALAYDTIARLREYLRDYPEGKHRDAVKDAAFAKISPQWENVQHGDSMVAIHTFGSSYPELRERFPATEVLDQRWKTAVAQSDLAGVSAFRDLPPDVGSRWPFTETFRTLSTTAWAAVLKKRDLEGIRMFAKRFPDLAKQPDADAAIDALYSDPDWVLAQNKLEHYRRFVQRHPKHPKSPSMEKMIIDLEVAAIAAGDHGVLPKAQQTGQSRGLHTEMTIQNDTEYELTVMFSGTESKKTVLSSGASDVLKLPNGSYKVAASVKAMNVRNYFGTDEFNGGVYSSSFYIKSESSGYLPGFDLPRKRR